MYKRALIVTEDQLRLFLGVYLTLKPVLKGYHIPYLQESISMAISLHKKFSTVHSIGWDIAITTDGPVFIEGNDNWEISLIQACSYGLKKEMLQYFS